MTTLGPDLAQVDYRLREDAGCCLHTEVGHEHPVDEHGHPAGAAAERQVAYRLAGDRPLEWVGDGLREVGLEPGTVLDEAGKDAARLLARGRDPRLPDHTRAGVLVRPKQAVDPRAKLPALPLVRAVRAAAAAHGLDVEAFLARRGDAKVVARYGRLQRGVARQETRTGAGMPAAAAAHTAPVKDLEGLARVAGVSLDDLYEAKQLATARQHRDATVAVGNRGYDLTFDLPKSYSVLVAMADPATAAQLEEVYLQAVRETVSAVQGWAGYGMRGHHGDGQTGQRVDGTGVLGWMNVHRTARPVDGQPPDPHLHAHVTLLNLVRGVDGKWSTLGAGGRDIHRHAHAADAHLRARLRAITGQRWGVEWERDPRTGGWEIAGVPPELRRLFSKRQGQVKKQLERQGLDPELASTAQAKDAATQSRQAKPGPAAADGDLRGLWHEQARALGADPGAVVAAAMPGLNLPTAGPDTGPDRDLPDVEPVPPTAPDRTRPGPVPVPGHDLAAFAAHVLRGPSGQVGVRGGVMEHRKVLTRADILAAVMDAVPAGIADLAAGERLTDLVLEQDAAVALPPGGQAHLSNSARYTSAAVVDAEHTVLAAAADRHAAGYATVPAEVVDLAVTAYEASAGFELSHEQRQAVRRLASAGHGMDTVVGVAGAGKTTLMSALRSAHEAAGHTVAGAATAAVAVKNLHHQAGIPTRTVASWLARITTHGPRALAGIDVLVLDEAAMVDDRHLAALLAAAGHSRTQLVAIGDPQQLKAIGVGGTFAAVHHLVSGPELTENRRQRDHTERAALATWRTGQRAAAVHAWAESGRVHALDTAADAHTAMVATWTQERGRWADPYERAEQLLLLAHTNTDVARLNQLARAARQDAGDLGPDHAYTGQDTDVRLAVGDQVMALRNNHDLGVLNGHRGIVTAIDATDGRVQLTRREDGPDGPVLTATWLPADYVREHLRHAYAMTAAKAQGLSAERALVYGVGMDAHVLYPAMSRDRARADLYLALHPLEDDADRARHGTPATDTDRLARAVTAYTATLTTAPDTLVITELGHTLTPLTAPPPAAAPTVDGPASHPADPAPPTPEPEPAPASKVPSWRRRPHGALSDRQLRARIGTLTQARDLAADQAAAARHTAETITEPAALQPVRDLLAQADQQQATAGAHRQHAGQVHAALVDQQRVQRVDLAALEELRVRAARPILGRRLLGQVAQLEERTRQQATRISDLAAQHATAQAAATTAAQAAAALRQQAGARPEETSEQTLTRLARDHADLADLLTRRAREQAGLASVHQRNLTALQAEAQLRAGLPADRQAAEHGARTRAARATAQTPPAPARPVHHRPTLDPDRGHGLGR